VRARIGAALATKRPPRVAFNPLFGLLSATGRSPPVADRKRKVQPLSFAADREAMFRAEVGSRAAHDIGGGNRKGPTQDPASHNLSRPRPSSALADHCVRSRHGRTPCWMEPSRAGPPCSVQFSRKRRGSAPSSSNVQEEILTVPSDRRHARHTLPHSSASSVNASPIACAAWASQGSWGPVSSSERSSVSTKGQAGGA